MKPDGGPAFPRRHSWDESPHSGFHEGDRPVSYMAQAGMSLRDYFAAQAIPRLTFQKTETQGLIASSPTDTAAYAYAIADAMLAERAK